MSLPVIKNAPVYSLHLKILDKKINFVPFTVEQEKGYISAIADKNTEDIVNNYLFLAKSCIHDDIDWKNISLIDFITIAINIRAKSQGEIISLQKKECKKCKKSFPFDINIEDCLAFENVDVKKIIHKIDDNLSLELKPLGIDYLYEIDNMDTELDIYMTTVTHSISKIFFNDEIFTNLDPKEVRENCVNNLSRGNINAIIQKISELITLTLKFEIECPHCKEKERLTISNFLEFLK